jgi:anti-sigma-K factor RskA
MRHLQLTDDLEGQASLYAMDALPDDERVEYARHLEEDRCAVCRAAVREFQTATSLLAYSVPPVAPPASLKARLLQQARGSAPAPRQQVSFFKRRWLELATSLAAAAAVAVMIVAINSNLELRRLTDQLNSRISQLEVQLAQQRTLVAAVTAPENRVINLAGQGTNVGARGRIVWDQSGKRWLISVRGLPRVSDSLTYQLWFVPKNGKPLSAAVFNTEANGSAEVEVELPQNLPALSAAAVTTEPAGGLPAPTGAFALLGAAD